jgi:hypothetical protein
MNMAAMEGKVIISILIAIFGLFLLFTAVTSYQATKLLDMLTLLSFVGGLVSFGIAFYLSGKK